MESLRGKLLIANPGLFDYFRRAVILVVEHSAEGAFGVILNRPSETLVGDVVPPLGEIADPDLPVRVGGPVGEESLVILGEFAEPGLTPKAVVGGVGVV